MSDGPPTTPAEAGDENPLAQLSTAMVRIYKEQLGRGPTKARSDWAGPDTVVCQLWETFTPAERSMVTMGEHQRLRDTRLFSQYAAEDDFRKVTEDTFGRQVRAFVGGTDTREDMAVELFVLEPDGATPE